MLERVGVGAELVRWNESPGRLAAFAGFFIPGGWSYQDRVRAGCVAAKSPLLEGLVREVEKGKPALGICNGAQILVELGVQRLEPMTNNPAKYGGLVGFGLTIEGRVPIHVPVHPEAEQYLMTKRERMGHTSPEEDRS